MTISPRVLQVLGPSTGGIRRHVAFLAGELRRRGWSVGTAGPDGVLDGLGPLDAPPLDFVVPIPSGLAVARIPAARRALRRAMGDYDVVHAHGLTAGWLAALSRRRGTPTLVVTVHNLVLDEVAGRAAALLRALERRLPSRVDGVIAVSPEIASYLAARRGGDHVTMVGPLGPPPCVVRSRHVTRAALGVSPDTPLVVCVARLHPQKGLDVLVAAVPRLLERVAAAQLAIVGEGPRASALRDQVAALGLTGRVIFAAPENPADELGAADVVAVPSRWESGPLVLSEAMLLGRPVVATPVGSVRELVVDGETGWLVPVGDPVALADALVEALSDPTEARRRADAGHRKAQTTLDMAARVSAVEDVYRASLGRR